MTLTKAKMVSAIGRRTRLRNRDIQRTIEALIDVWTEELVSSGRIELQGFCVLETQTIDRGENLGKLRYGDAPRYIRQVVIKVNRRVKRKLNTKES
ncbi:MAG: HU family DNA-binding protein [bacterium]|nr:HU family DNA-binding protein [bacterium]